MASAKATTLVPASSRSYRSLLTSMTHRRGEGTPLCGVTLLTVLVDCADPIVKYTTLLVSMVCMSPTIGRPMPSSVRAPVIVAEVTLLNAPSMSRKAAREYSLLRDPLSIQDTMERICLYVTHAVHWRVGFGW